jgi:hypothetical protein
LTCRRKATAPRDGLIGAAKMRGHRTNAQRVGSDE